MERNKNGLYTGSFLFYDRINNIKFYKTLQADTKRGLKTLVSEWATANGAELIEE